MEILPFLLAPFLASLILTGIHAYLGVHVVERGVIFVDLALAQIAALGATIAILIGMDPHGTGAYWLSLAFTFVGAAVFAFVPVRSAITATLRFNHFNDELDQRCRRVELPALLTLGHCKLPEKVLVDPAEDIPIEVHGNFGKGLE